MATIRGVARRVVEQLGLSSTMKVQKLCYYSQAYSLSYCNKPLFDEDFEAWRGGPVCASFYQFHKGMFSLVPEQIQLTTKDQLTDEERSIVDLICARFRHFSGNNLSEKTHSEDPWKDQRKGLAPNDRSRNIITKEAMKKYYSEHDWLPEEGFVPEPYKF